jgi:proteasome assembly chaperone (PAC2) family protein
VGEVSYTPLVLDIQEWPRLHDPVMLVALTGWVDGGLAGSGALAAVAEQLDDGRPLGVIDLSELVDLQQTRPTVSLHDGVTRQIEWPRVDLMVGHAGRDLVLVAGPEPSIRWQAFTDELVGLARRLEVKMTICLGGMPAAVSHRRPFTTLSTATARSVAQEVGGVLRADYVGPTGAQTVLQVALGKAGIPCVGLWAQVPHYVAGTPSPPAVRSLLERVREIAGVEIDLRSLDAQSDEYLEKVESGLEERPDVADLIRQLEGQTDPSELPSGDDLAREIERFLRDERSG